MTVTAICKQADITRATFYLHYVDIYAVLDEVLTEALEISENEVAPETMLAMVLQAGQKADSTAFIKENYAMLPICQRVADHGQYQALFADEDLGPYILQYIFSHQKDSVVPLFQKQFHLDERLAENLYLFLVSGAFAINQHHKWKRMTTGLPSRPCCCASSATAADPLKKRHKKDDHRCDRLFVYGGERGI